MKIEQGLSRVASVSDGVASYLPEPATQGYGLFKDVMDVVGAVGSSAIGGVPGMLTGDYAELFNAQVQASKELQSVSLLSNIERSQHESKMAAIRNIRVG